MPFGTTVRSAICGVALAAFSAQAGIISIYYPSWVPTSSLDMYDFSQIDITNYAFFTPNRDGDVEEMFGGLNEELMSGLVAKSHAAGAKCLLSFVGGSGPTYDPDSVMIALTANPVAQTHLITNLMNTLRTFGFDGLGNDWEPFDNPSIRGPAFEGLMLEIRDSLDAQESVDGKEYLLTCALLGDYWGKSPYWAYITPATEAVTDYLEVMTYNFKRDAVGATQKQMQKWIDSAHIPPAKLLQGTPFYSDCGVWPPPAGFQGRRYRDVRSDTFDACAALPESVSVVGSNPEWLISPMQARELAQSTVNQGLGGMMVWELTSDLSTNNPLSIIRNMREVLDWNSRDAANREYVLEDSANETAASSIGYATWQAAFSDSCEESVFLTNNAGDLIAQGGYNNSNGGVSATLHRTTSDTSRVFHAGFNLVLDTNTDALPFLNLSKADTLLIVLTFAENETLTVGLHYPGNQASAVTTLTGTGEETLYRIPIESFIDSNPARKRGPFVPANTGIISFQWKSFIDTEAIPLPDSAYLSIKTVAINSLVGTSPINAGILQKNQREIGAVCKNGMVHLTGVATAGIVTIFNAHGQIVSHTASVPNTGISVAGLASGVYLVHVREVSGKTGTVRLMIEE